MKINLQDMNDRHGKDDENFICSTGYLWADNYFKENNIDKILSKEAVEIFKNAAANGNITESQAKWWSILTIQTAEKLVKNLPEEFLNHMQKFRVLHLGKTYNFNSKQEALDHKNYLVEEFQNNPLDRISVLQCIYTNDGLYTLPIQNLHEIVDGFHYKVFDEVSGTHHDFSSAEEAIADINVKKEVIMLNVTREIRIQEHFEEKEEGYTFWKDLPDVS